MTRMWRRFAFGVTLAVLIPSAVLLRSQAPAQPDWAKVDEELMRHFQALLRIDTSDPPGKERPAAEYLKQVLEKEGIPAQLFALEPDRPNVVARLKGNGRKRPLLIIGHTDVVNVDPAKWKFPPFSATRDGGYVYGRGTVDDKDNLATTLMVMLQLKRLNVPLDRDVIFLVRSGRGGQHAHRHPVHGRPALSRDRRRVLLRRGRRRDPRRRPASSTRRIATLEKIPYAIELTAKGVAGHGSVPLRTNAVVHLSTAVGKVGAWKPDIRLNETTGTYFRRLATISSPADAERYRNVLVPNSKAQADADEYFLDNEPAHASMLRTSVSPNILGGGYRVNVIPSEAKATLDVRMLPDEDPAKFLEMVKTVINDPTIDVRFGAARHPAEAARGAARLGSVQGGRGERDQALQRADVADDAHGRDRHGVPARQGDAVLRRRPGMDVEDGPKGFGAHSDQERILESELSRFMKFHWDIVVDLARTR